MVLAATVIPCLGGLGGVQILPANGPDIQPHGRRCIQDDVARVDTPGAVHPHGQLLLAECDHTSTQPPYLPLAEHRRLEIKADPDSKPQHQRANALAGRVIGGDGCQFVERHHEPLDLLLRRDRRGIGCRSRAQLVDPTADGLPLDPHLVERLAESLVSGVVFLPGHALPSSGHVLIEFLDSPAQVRQRGVLLVWHLAGGLGPSLREKPLANRLPTARFVDALHQRVEHQLQHRIGVHRVVVALGAP